MQTKDIQNRISTNGAGWIFSAVDFADITDRNAIDQALFRLSKRGVIRKLATGLYDTPIVSERFGEMTPDPDKVAQAIAKKFGYHIQIHPALAANYLGLSLQVPAQLVYLTDGHSKVVKTGNHTLKFIHASSKKMLGAGTKAGLVIQALYYFGKDNLDEAFLVSRIRPILTDKDRDTLLTLIPKAPVWMQPILKQIML